MKNKELITRVQIMIEQGVAMQDIRSRLLNEGLTKEDIDEVYTIIKNSEVNNLNQIPTVQTQQDTQKSTEKSSFTAETEGYAFSGFFRRGFAFFIDLMLLTITLSVTGFSDFALIGSWNWTGDTGLLTEIQFAEPLRIMAFYFLIVIYYAVLESLTGASIGKHILGLRLVDTSKDKPVFVKVFLKSLVRPFEMFLIGIASFLLSPKNQTLGDRLAETLVIKKSLYDKSVQREQVSTLRKTFGILFIFLTGLFTVLILWSVPQVLTFNKLSRDTIATFQSFYPDDIEKIYYDVLGQTVRDSFTFDEVKSALVSPAFRNYMTNSDYNTVKFYSWTYNNRQALIVGENEDIQIQITFELNTDGEWELLSIDLKELI